MTDKTEPRCVVCGAKLKPHEEPEGICDPCLKVDAEKWPPVWRAA